MQAKYLQVAQYEVRYAEYMVEDAELVLVAYGSPARICKTVVNMARDEGNESRSASPDFPDAFPVEQDMPNWPATEDGSRSSR